MVHLNVEMHNTRNSEDIVYSLWKHKVLRDIDKLYYFRKEFKQKNELTPKEVTKVWNDIYGLRVDEHGIIDTSKSTEIYKRLKAASDVARTKYAELLPDDYSNKSLGSKDEASALKALLGLTETEESPLPEEFSPKDKLYKYWEEAGLDKSVEEGGTGFSTYTEYFNNYLTEHKSKYITFDEYDYNKDVTENSVTARNNELIKCIQSRLTSPDTFNARYTPGGFTNAKRDKWVIRAAYSGRFKTLQECEDFVDNATKEELESLDNTRDVTNVLTTAEYNAKNRVAAKVIGIMANHNTNAVYSKAMGSLKLKEPIEIFGQKLIDLNNSNTGRDYMLTLAELLAASVDAVKDPVLGDLMINSYTANVAALLARLGLSTEEIGLFLNQPIIKEVCNEAINRGDSNITRAIKRIATKYGMDVTGKYSGNTINKNDLFKSLNTGLKEKDVVQANILNAFYSISSVAQALSDFISKTKYTAANSIDNTIGGLLALVYDNKAANEQETSINKYLSMSFEGFSSQELIEKVSDLKSPIVLRKDLSLESMQGEEYKRFLDATPFAFEQMVHDAVRAYVKKLGKYFPYTTDLYESVYDTIYGNLVFGQMDQEIIDTINRQFPVYLLSSKPYSQFNPDATMGEGTSNNKQFYTVEFPRQLREFLEDRALLKEAQDKKAEFKALQEKYSFLSNTSLEGILDNSLLDKLIIEEYSVVNDNVNYLEDDEGIRFNITIEEDGQFDKDIKNDLVTAWDSLVKDKNLRVDNARNSLAHALFLYNFHTRGYEVGRNAFSNITPLVVKDTLMIDSYYTYSDFYNKLVEGAVYSVNSHRFLPLFYANNIDNNKLVKSVYTSINQEGRLNDSNLPAGEVIAKFGEPVKIVFDGGSKNNYNAIALPPTKRSGDMKNKRVVVPAFKIVDRNGSRLFVLQPKASTDGYNFADPQYNVRNVNSRVSYIEIPSKGISNTIVDYSMSDMSLVQTAFREQNEESEVGREHEPYVDNINMAPEIDPTDIEALQQEAMSLEQLARQEREKYNDC